jgi:SAM-dependent methyltransferase
VDVHGVDASQAMVDRLRAKPGGDEVDVTVADMAELPLPAGSTYGVVFVAFNTFFNLPTEEAQLRCLTRVGQLLDPDGCFVIEAFVPRDDPDPSAPTGAVTPRRITADEVVLTVSQVDPRAQTITGQHVHLRESGIRLRPWHLRYATPAQLDAMAARCGLGLVERHAGWADEPFGPDSSIHVSTYRPANVRSVREHPPAQQR